MRTSAKKGASGEQVNNLTLVPHNRLIGAPAWIAREVVISTH